MPTADIAPLLIVDGDNLAHRAYHSTPKSVANNAVAGFFSMLLRHWERESPRAIFVAWDTLGVDTYRNRLWPAYQSGRTFETEIVRQLGLLTGLCRACCFGVGQGPGYEADDWMAAACHAELGRGGSALLLTTDKDSYQLVSDRATVLSPKRGTTEPDRIGPLQVVERIGVLPEQIPDFKALAGDPSDKIPGIRGVGPKGAAAMLLRYGTLDAAIQGWKDADAEQARLFRQVATMQLDAPVELPSSPPDWAAGAEALRALGMDALAARLARA